MTTTATEQADKISLTTASNGDAPKRRGRPPGSKNKTTKAATKTTAPRVRRTTPAAPKATTTDVKAHAVLIENGSINVLLADGSSFKIDGPVFDRR